MDLPQCTKKVHCGEIFMSFDSTTFKKNFQIDCTICGNNFKSFNKYEIHIENQHFVQQQQSMEIQLESIKTNETNGKIENDTNRFNEDEKAKGFDVQVLCSAAFENSNSALDEFQHDSNALVCLEKKNKQLLLKKHRKLNPTRLREQTAFESSSKSDAPQAFTQTKKMISKKIISKKTDLSSSSDIKEKAETTSQRTVKTNKCFNGQLSCKICKENFSTQKLFQSHMRMHKEYKAKKCTICPKTFFTMNELKIHTRCHTGERPFLCTFCGDKFTTSSWLKTHIKRHHTFVRDKQCTICKKTFIDSSTLKCHVTVHSDDRPHKCSICDANFKRRFCLAAHMKSHENKREHKCEICSASFNLKCNLTSHKKKKHLLISDFLF